MGRFPGAPCAREGWNGVSDAASISTGRSCRAAAGSRIPRRGAVRVQPQRSASSGSPAAICQYSREEPKWTNTAGCSRSTVNGVPRRRSQITRRAALHRGRGRPVAARLQDSSQASVEPARGQEQIAVQVQGRLGDGLDRGRALPVSARSAASSQTRPVSICTVPSSLHCRPSGSVPRPIGLCR